MQKLSRMLKTLISDAVKSTGTYDPQITMCHFEEHLTLEEYRAAEGFLSWLHENNRAFGHGNVDQVYAEYLAAGGLHLPTAEGELSEEEQGRRGGLLADVLMLKMDKGGRYPTTWGDKTTLGLFLTVKRIIEEGE